MAAYIATAASINPRFDDEHRSAPVSLDEAVQWVDASLQDYVEGVDPEYGEIAAYEDARNRINDAHARREIEVIVNQINTDYVIIVGAVSYEPVAYRIAKVAS